MLSCSLANLDLSREGAVPCPPDPSKDWSQNFAEMIGYSDPQFIELMRLYLTIHRWESHRGTSDDSSSTL